MKLLPDCYLCAMRQALSAARMVSADTGFLNNVMRETSRILAEADPGDTPPEVGERFYRMIRERSGAEDPFKEQKRLQNEHVIALLPWLRDAAARSEDPLLTAVRLAIAGNAVDPGAQESFDLERSVMEAVEGEAGLEAYPEFARRLDGSRTVLVLADNCGEILFDRVLVETMLERARDAGRELEVTLAVRGGPVINDVTPAEAEELGLRELCRVVSTGLEMPGTVPARSAPEFQEVFRSADMVVSKGQGNWETLGGCDREVFFLFQAKCPPVAAVNLCREGQPLLLRGRGAEAGRSGA